MNKISNSNAAGTRGPAHSGMDYLDFLRQLDSNLNPRSYLEIGTNLGDSLSCFSCDAIGVDPNFAITQPVLRDRKRLHLFQMRSDAFFAEYDPRAFFPQGIDVAFLDGMHLFEFLLRDFINTERLCHSRSVILLHDCLPTNTRMAERMPRVDAAEDVATRGHWTGDVWRLLPVLRKYRPDLRILPLDCAPTGLVAITRVDPASTILHDNYYAIIDESISRNLELYGIDRLWGEFPPISAASLFQPPHHFNLHFPALEHHRRPSAP